MPQILTNTKGADGKLDFGGRDLGGNALSGYPKQASIVAQVVTTWAYVEACLGNLLACFLRADATLTMEMYGRSAALRTSAWSWRQPRARRSMLMRGACLRISLPSRPTQPGSATSSRITSGACAIFYPIAFY